MKELRKLSRNGNATTVAISKAFLAHLRWRGGDGIIVELTERNTLELRPPTPGDMRAKFQSMTLPDDVPAGTR